MTNRVKIITREGIPIAGTVVNWDGMLFDVELIDGTMYTGEKEDLKPISEQEYFKEMLKYDGHSIFRIQ